MIVVDDNFSSIVSGVEEGLVIDGSHAKHSYF